MTDEQIKQNAVKYSEQHCSGYVDGSLVDAYIAGAHSRDEEIGRMNTTIRLYANQIALLRKEIEQLHNPWISVEERLPDAHTPVYAKNNNSTWFFALRTGNKVRPWYNIVGRCREEVTHWMPIQEPKIAKRC